MTLTLTPLVLTKKAPDLYYVEMRNGIGLIANKGGLRSELLTILTEAGLNPLMQDDGELLITYFELLNVEEFSDTFAKWAVENNLYVEYDCDH